MASDASRFRLSYNDYDNTNTNTSVGAQLAELIFTSADRANRAKNKSVKRGASTERESYPNSKGYEKKK